MITKKIVILLALALSFASTEAVKPDWSVNAVDYNYSMSYVGVVFLDFVEQADENSMLAAFVDDELRGVATPIFDAQTGDYTFYLLVYSNIDSQMLRFEYYNSTTDAIVSFEKVEIFSADALIGSPFDPYIWATPDLVDANLISYELAGQIRSEIVDFDVNVVIDSELDITNAVATYEVSGGAVVKIIDEIQITGITENDFTYSQVYTVTSADGYTENIYTVNIILNDLTEVNTSTVISPNGDGVNDAWLVEDVEKFEEANFYIMDSYGHKLWESVGYDNSWDATYKGTYLPTGSYYYVIENAEGETLSGTISIVR